MKVGNVRLRDAVRVGGPGGGTRDYWSSAEVDLEFVSAPPALRLTTRGADSKAIFTPISNVLQWDELESEPAKDPSTPEGGANPAPARRRS